jgi:hypothetical protein
MLMSTSIKSGKKSSFLCFSYRHFEGWGSGRNNYKMDGTNATLRDLVQWTSPSITYLLHPLVVAGHRRSVTPYSGVSFVTGAVTGRVGWADEARLVRRQTGLFGHPAYWAWVGALEGVLDVLLTAASLSVEEVVCPPPAGGAAATKKPSPYVHNWQMALLAVSERLVWTFLTRPLRIASNRLHAQLVPPPRLWFKYLFF